MMSEVAFVFSCGMSIAGPQYYFLEVSLFHIGLQPAGYPLITVTSRMKTVREQSLVYLSILAHKHIRYIQYPHGSIPGKSLFQLGVQDGQPLFTVATRENLHHIQLCLRLLPGNQCHRFLDAPDDFLIRIDVQIIGTQHHKNFLCRKAIQFTVQYAPLYVLNPVPSVSQVDHRLSFKQLLPYLIGHSAGLIRQPSPEMSNGIAQHHNLRLHSRIVFQDFLMPFYPLVRKRITMLADGSKG